MTVRQKIHELRKKFHDKITNFSLVKKSIYGVIPGYLGLVVLGVIIAFLFGGTRQGPGEYFIWTNWISDLGGSPYTPAPFLYDIACILAGLLTLPLTFYLESKFAPIPENSKDLIKCSRLRFRLASYAFFFSIIGNLGYIGVGIFSEDRNYFSLHGITSSLAFGGFSLGAFFLGWMIILYIRDLPNWLGVYGIFGPLTVIILFGIFSDPLLEWLLLFSILAWIIPLSLFIIKNEESSQNSNIKNRK
ncbi:MAG: DUF998 domain-containing protein [Promethearchaeia archaeon]